MSIIKRALILALVWLGVAMTGFFNARSDSQTSIDGIQAAEKPLPFRIVAQGGYSEQRDRNVAVIAKKSEWKNLWQAMFPQASADSLPPVDFENKMLIAVFRGGMGGSPYQLSITDVVKLKDRLTVSISERVSGRGCLSAPVFLLPFQIIEIDRLGKKFRNHIDLLTELERSSFDRACQPAAMTVVDSLDIDQAELDGYALQAAQITGDSLKLKVSYNACDEGLYPTFLFLGAINSGAPQPTPAVALLLRTGARCTGNVSINEDLFFDLTPLKKKAQESQGTASGVIRLRIAGVNDALNYAF